MSDPISPLRGPSARPLILTDDKGGRIESPPTPTQPGIAGPLGRDRVITALPLGGGPVQLAPARLLHDGDFGYVVDLSGNVIGENAAVWVQRMLTATVAGDTRRL